MWRIDEHRRVEKQLAAVPKDILKRYEKWLDIAMISGPPGLRAIKGFHDEAVSGAWKASSDKHWQTLCTIADRPDLKDHPTYRDRNARRKNLRKVLETLDEIFATRTTKEWSDALGVAGVPCMPISSLEDVVADRHLDEVDFWQEIDHPTEGRIRLMKPPYTLARSPASIRRAPPRYAEHTREILDELGYDAAAADALIASGGAVEQPEDK